MKVTIEVHTELSDQVVETLVRLEEGIFEHPMTADDCLGEFSGRKGLILLVAFVGGQACGYKVGYSYSSDIFLSLSGGVLPDFRRRGIASQLMTRQHQEAKAAGFRYIRTHTKNKYREMLILNIRSGFDVTGVYKSLKEKFQGIILEKEL